jgi:hypothetical protein
LKQKVIWKTNLFAVRRRCARFAVAPHTRRLQEK